MNQFVLMIGKVYTYHMYAHTVHVVALIFLQYFVIITICVLLSWDQESLHMITNQKPALYYIINGTMTMLIGYKVSSKWLHMCLFHLI